MNTVHRYSAMAINNYDTNMCSLRDKSSKRVFQFFTGFGVVFVLPCPWSSLSLPTCQSPNDRGLGCSSSRSGGDDSSGGNPTGS